MFFADITAKEIVDTIKAEEDTVIDIPDEYYYMWLDSEEQLLYHGVIKEERSARIDFSGESFSPGDIPTDDNQEKISADDIYKIFYNSRELEKCNVSAFVSMGENMTYCVNDRKISINCPDGQIDIVYYVKPLRVYKDGILNDRRIALPNEFADLIKSRLRGEKYRLSNDDALCAKWIGEHNSLLENFKEYLKKSRPDFSV